MEKTRLEAFSDGVIAIILTIMVLDLKVPKEHTFEALGSAWPVFGAYALSYWNVFLIWLTHHDIFSPLKQVNRAVLVANGLLLFVVSFIPFVTAFASEAHWTEPTPVVLYGVLMAVTAIAFARLRWVAIASARARGSGERRFAEIRVSLATAGAFLGGAAAGWFAPRWALLFYAAVPLMRFVQRRKLVRTEQSAA